MLVGIIIGCVIGAVFPVVKNEAGEVVAGGATVLEPLGTIFTNLMFCIVVPMVFCSIASSIANMQSMKRAGKIMGVTMVTFFATAAISAVIMYVVCRFFPVVPTGYANVEAPVKANTLGFADMVVNFFTVSDFSELLSRRAILPLIVMAVIFGFGVQLSGGPKTKTAQLLEDLTNCIMKAVKIITYYAPIGFLGFFATLVATYGPDLIGDYSVTLIVYYALSFVYMFISFPIYALIGGGRKGPKVMF